MFLPPLVKKLCVGSINWRIFFFDCSNGHQKKKGFCEVETFLLFEQSNNQFIKPRSKGLSTSKFLDARIFRRSSQSRGSCNEHGICCCAYRQWCAYYLQSMCRSHELQKKPCKCVHRLSLSRNIKTKKLPFVFSWFTWHTQLHKHMHMNVMLIKYCSLCTLVIILYFHAVCL